MVQTIVTPEKKEFDMSVSLPDNYVGKQVHILFYIDEEIKTTPASVTSSKKPSDFFGILTKAEGEQLEKHIKQMRSEWDRSF